MFKGIVKLHGGRVGVESEGSGMGSTYYIDIPVANRKKGVAQSSAKKLHVVHQGSRLDQSDSKDPSKTTFLDVEGQSGLHFIVAPVEQGKQRLNFAIKY